MSVLASDSFDRADEAPLASPWGSRNVAGDLAFNLTGNKAVRNADLDAREYYDGGVTWPNDQYSQSQLTVTGTTGGGSGIGLSLRGATGATTFYRFAIDHAASNNWDLSLLTAGALFGLATGTQAFSDGATFKFRIIGGALDVSINGGAPFASATDFNIASGKPGLAYSSSETSASVDVWEGGDNSVTLQQQPIASLWLPLVAA